VVVTTVTTGDYQYSFEDLARDLRTPGTTLRRYFKVYQQFIPNKTVNRATRFDKEARQLFDDINKMYKQRMSTAEILQELAATRMPTLDVRPSSAPMDLKSSPPAPGLPDTLAALIPLAERFLDVYERQTKALEAIASALASNSPFKGTDKPGDTNHRLDHQTGQDKPVGNVDREAVIARVLELHERESLGQYAITTRLRREGLRLSPRGEISKSTVARILKGEVK